MLSHALNLSLNTPTDNNFRNVIDEKRDELDNRARPQHITSHDHYIRDLTPRIDYDQRYCITVIRHPDHVVSHSELTFKHDRDAHPGNQHNIIHRGNIVSSILTVT